jgi:hypothetical protein
VGCADPRKKRPVVAKGAAKDRVGALCGCCAVIMEPLRFLAWRRLMDERAERSVDGQ